MTGWVDFSSRPKGREWEAPDSRARGSRVSVERKSYESGIMLVKLIGCASSERSEANQSEAKRGETRRSEAKRSEAKRGEAKRSEAINKGSARRIFFC